MREHVVNIREHVLKMASLINLPSTSPSSSPIKPKKRLRDESNWKKNVTKSKKAKGEEHLSHNSKRIISARKTGPPCGCKRQCFAKIDDDQKGQILTSFNALGDKSLQDAYLHGLISHRPVDRHRSSKPAAERRQRSNTYIYKVKLS